MELFDFENYVRRHLQKFTEIKFSMTDFLFYKKIFFRYSSQEILDDHMCNFLDDHMCKKVKQFTSGDWRSRTKEGEIFKCTLLSEIIFSFD